MKALIIHNPAAGQRDHSEELAQIVALLKSRGWQVVGVEPTLGYSDATTFARQAAAQKCDVVFVAGGDGTLAQAVDGLVGTDTALAVLPAGTGNVMARQLNLPVPGGLHPRPMLEAARLALEGQIRRVDVGRVRPRGQNGPAHHFLCWTGVGFDAQVNQLVNQDYQRKKRLGLVASAVTAVSLLSTFAGTSAVVRVDGHRVSRRLIMLEASNIQLYGVFFRMAPRAVLDDGWLDVYCFQGSGAARTLLHAIRLLLSRHVQDPKVDVYRAQHVEVSTYRPLPVHVDGDYIGNTPIVIDVVPRAVNLLVPPYAPASLFTDGTGMLPPESAWDWMRRMAHDAHEAIRELGALP